MRRKLKARRFEVALLSLGLWLAGSAPAFAYIDPGTGSFIFQIVIAGVVGAGLTIKTFWRRITGLFSRKKPPADTASQTAGAD